MTDRRARFEEIYDAYSGLILAYAAQRTSHPYDAADIVAETFVVAWRRIDDVPDGEEARPWLYGVARRVLSRHHRGDRRRRRLDERLTSELPRLLEHASPALAEGPDRAAIAAAFAELSDGDRELLTLVAWDGLGRDEIAVVLGCSRATVRVRLHRARKRFERHLRQVGVKRLPADGDEPGRWATARPELEEA
ncbi:MAG TPA: sigma-70 family RNA polymerase sigma factor [Nitriliruptorales bacterium]|nr:sigma-70 family RNA polymerase sigma factor [Nitriliruptorales bacterium]